MFEEHKVPETRWVFDFSARLYQTLSDREKETLRNKRKEHPNAARAYLIKRFLKRTSRQMRWFAEFTVWDNPKVKTIHRHITALLESTLGLAYYGGLDEEDFHRFLLEGMGPVIMNDKGIQEYTPGWVRNPGYRAKVNYGLAQISEAFWALHLAYNGSEPFRATELYEPLKNILTTVRHMASNANYLRTTFAAHLTAAEREYLGLR